VIFIEVQDYSWAFYSENITVVQKYHASWENIPGSVLSCLPGMPESMPPSSLPAGPTGAFTAASIYRALSQVK
jgi:hypothetical protein